MVALNDRVNGSKPPNPPQGESIFSAADILLQRRMRFNPLRALDPENLSIALDQFDIGILRQAALLWEAMCKRDDTLITIKPHLENSVASKDWGVFKKKGADETEASRHAACLGWFYDHVTATDAFDRNERGGRERLIEHMMRAESFLYAVQHLVWKPQPGKMIEVEGSAPVPVITAQIEYVPLWYFENTTGTLRFLPFGGFGLQGEELDWDNGEWMVTVGRGLMFAASICYVFKRLSFQDWTIFNERYAQNKVVGMTPASEESDQGRAFGSVVSHFNGDQAMVFYEMQPGEEPPIKLIGPTGTASVEIWEKFIERQDRKMSVMYRGSDLSMMSRGGEKEGDVRGASLQSDETEKMEAGCCRMIAGTLHHFIDRQVIRFCFGEGVEPLAYFGLPDMDLENTGDLRESAGFLADRGVKVKAASVADRLGVELAAEGEDALQPIGVPSSTGDEKAAEKMLTANSREKKAERLMQLVEEALRTQNAYDPNEERDENGRWINGEVVLPDAHWTGTYDEKRERAREIMRQIKPVLNEHRKIEINFTHGGAKKTYWGRHTDHEIQSAQGLRKIVQHATWQSSAPDYEGKEHVRAWHKYTTPVRIGDTRYTAEITVKETEHGKGSFHAVHLHRLRTV